MANNLLNLFHILNISDPCYWLVIPVWLAIGWLSRLLCVSMMAAGESAVNYQHLEGAYLSVKRLHDAERWF
jgi:hypothetical protein